MEFEVIEDKCIAAVHRRVVEALIEIKRDDGKGFKRIMSKLQQLTKACHFNKPEQWKPLKGEHCRKFGIWELKPKPYRLAFFKDSCKGKEVFVFYAIWRKKETRENDREINKICREASLFIESWNRFKEERRC